MITSGVIITGIICLTLIVLSAINTAAKSYERKRTVKHLMEFKKAFPTFEDKIKADKSKDDFFTKF